MRNLRRRRVVGLLVIAALGAMAIYLVRGGEQRLPLVGIVRATEVRIAPEVGGRLAAIKVERGAKVRAGDVVAELAAPELTASVAQASAALDVARASRAHVFAGVRDEEIAVLAAETRKARSRLNYAQQQLGRIAQLARDEFASLQSLDQAEQEAAAARADVVEPDANLASGKAGPTREERGIADAQVAAAGASLEVLERRLDKILLKSPVDGTIGVIVAEVGEALRAGQPVLTIEATAQPWFSFNVREDQLDGITVGTRVTVLSSGAAAPAPGIVTGVLPLGEFAVWQAERAVGAHDRNALRLRIDPLAEKSRFEPGMTVWLQR